MFGILAAALAVGVLSSTGIADARTGETNTDRQEASAQIALASESSGNGEGQADLEVAGTTEEEAPESAVSSPPMEMDDPGTPGRQGVEVNLVGTLARVGDGRGSETLVDANYGIGARLQLKLERPYLTDGVTGERSQRGLGATEIGVKWRCWDRNGLQVAVYPQYSFNDGFRLKDEAGNPLEDQGSAAYLPVLISKTVHHIYTLAANFGYRKNVDHSFQDTIVAFGLGRGIGDNIRVLGEVYSERDEHFDNRQTDVRFGWVQTLFPKILARSKMELVGFASLGHSIGRTEEGEPITSFAFGVSMIKKPKGEY